MYRKLRTSWTEAELKSLFATYFGEKLSPAQLERLVADVAASLANRRVESDACADQPEIAPDRRSDG
ncbi:MAG: hypothetical protein HY690_17980 [Chloroflexi bacterium]|nr:hypothetical protein [Chloroflexota bacterium]